MDRRRFTFYEFSGYQTDGGLSEDIRGLGLSGESIGALRRISETIVAPKNVFDFSTDTIRARSLVGVLTVDHVQIEILPKLIASERDAVRTQDMLRNLMFMLSYTHQIDAEDTGLATLSRDFGSFVEAYIAIFADRL